MEIELSPELEKRLNELVAAGRYGSASEVATVALESFLLEVEGASSTEPLTMLKGIAGTFDSSKRAPDERYSSDFGDSVDEKLARQGVRTSWRR